MRFALAGGLFNHSTDGTLAGYTTYTLEDKEWQPKRNFFGISKFTLNMRKVVGSDHAQSRLGCLPHWGIGNPCAAKQAQSQLHATDLPANVALSKQTMCLTIRRRILGAGLKVKCSSTGGKGGIQ